MIEPPSPLGGREVVEHPRGRADAASESASSPGGCGAVERPLSGVRTASAVLSTAGEPEAVGHPPPPVNRPVRTAEPGSWYARRGKRVADLVGATLLLLLLGPPAVVAALALRTTGGPGVIFRQARAGRGGVPFTLLKLRTMRTERFPGEPDADRLTRSGRVLRATALDEVPQLLNVLRGEMSLVGPRPLPPDYLPLYSAREATRLRVRPGLAGAAQARGRNAVPWTERLECDARYAERITLRGDLSALLGSAAVLLSGRGVSAPGHATMPPLMDRLESRDVTCSGSHDGPSCAQRSAKS